MAQNQDRLLREKGLKALDPSTQDLYTKMEEEISFFSPKKEIPYNTPYLENPEEFYENLANEKFEQEEQERIQKEEADKAAEAIRKNRVSPEDTLYGLLAYPKNSTEEPLPEYDYQDSVSQLAFKEEVEQKAQVLGISNEEAADLVANEKRNSNWNQRSFSVDISGLKEKVQQTQNTKKKEAPKFELSQNVRAAYYAGVDKLDSDIVEELEKEWGEGFKKASPEIRNFYLKSRIVSDICNNSGDERLKQWWETYSPYITPKNQEALDSIFNSYYATNKDTMFEKAPFWTKAWNWITGRDGNTKTVEIKGGDLTLDDYIDEDKIEARQKENKKVRNTNLLTSTDLLQETEKKVYQDLDKVGEATYQKAKFDFSKLSDVEKHNALLSFKEHSRQISPIKFKEFEFTDKIPLSKEDYYDLIAKYNSDMAVGGSQYADTRLQNYYQNLVAEHTSALEDAGTTVSQFGWNTVTTTAPHAMQLAWAAGEMVKGRSFEEGWNNAKLALYLAKTYNTLDIDDAYAKWSNGVGPTNVIQKTTEQDAAYLSWATPFELAEQAGYIAGFTLGSKGINAVLGGGAKLMGLGISKVAAPLAKTEAGMAAIAKVNQQLRNTAAIGTMFAQSANNATLEASDVRYSYIQEATNKIKQATEQEFMSALYDKIINDTNYWAHLYFQETGIPLGDLLINKESGSGGKQYSQQDIDTLMKHFSNRDDVRESYMRNIQSQIDRDIKVAELAATEGAKATWSIEMATELAINATLRKSLLPPSVRRVFSSKSPLSKMVDVAFGNGKYKAFVKDYTKLAKAGEYIERAVGEFGDEYGEALGSAFGSSYAESAFKDMQMSAYGNNATNSALYYSITQAIASGFEAASAEMFSKETLQSGLYGALASLAGLPGIKNKTSISARREGESWTNYARRVNPFMWDSVFTLPFSDAAVVEENQKRQGLQDFLNAYLENPEKLAMFTHAGKAVSYTQQLAMAEATGDEKAIRDAQTNLLREQVTFLASMEGTTYHENMMRVLNKRANLKKENLKDPNSEESQAVQEYYSEGSNNKVLNQEEALEKVISSAKTMLDLALAAKIEISKIKNLYGEDIDTEFLLDQVKNRLLLRDRKNRINELTKEVDEQTKQLDLEDGTPSSKLSDSAKKFKARYGDKYVRNSTGEEILPAEGILEMIKMQAIIREQQIMDSKDLSPKQKRKAIAALNKSVASLDKEITDYKKEIATLSKKERTLSAKEIMELPTRERGIFVAADTHSKEQKQEIKKLNSIRKQLVDLARLQEDYDNAMRVERELASNPSYFGDYHAKVHQQALKARLKSKYAYLTNDRYSYDEFKKEYYAAYTEENLSREDEELLMETIKDSPHYQRFESDQKSFLSVMTDITRTSKFQDLRGDKKSMLRANIFSVLNYFHENGIPIDTTEGIENLMNKIAKIPADELQKQLRRQETVKGEYQMMPVDIIAPAIKTLYDSVLEDKGKIEERNKKPQNASAEYADNNPTSPSTAEVEPREDSNPIEKVVSKVNKLKNNEFTKKAAKKHKTNKQIVEKKVDEIINKVNTALENDPDTDIKKIIDLEVSALSNLKEKGAVLEVFDAVFKADDSKAPIEERPQPVKIEGFDKAEGEFMRAHSSFSTLATTDATVGSTVYFYTPSTLVSEDGSLPVVAMIENPKGSIKIKGKSYSPVGILEEPTEAMLDENKDKAGDFMYSQEAAISTLQKEGFKPDYFGRDIPVRDAIGSRSIDDIVNNVTVETEIVDENPQKQVVFHLTRGRVRSKTQEGHSIPIEFHNTAPSKVKNKNGQTIFDVLSEFKQAREAEQQILANPESSAEDKEKAKKERINATEKVLGYNSYISNVVEILNELNDSAGPIIKLLEDSTADMSKFMKDINHKLARHIYIPDGYTIGIMNSVVDSETGTLSFDVVLNYPNKGGHIVLHSVNGLSRQKRMSNVDRATILYNLTTDSKGNPRSHDGKLLFRYQVSYTRKTKDGEEKINKSAIRTAIEEGVFTTAHKTFDYPVNDLTISFKHAARPVTSQDVTTDTAAPVKASTDTITNNQNEKMDPDTGSKVNEQSPSEIEVETTGGEVSTKEIIEEAQVETPSTIDEVDPFADSEEDTSMLEDDNDFDLGEDTEYQLVEARYSLLSKARNYFKGVLKSTESKKDYTELNKNTDEEFQNDTKSNAFIPSKSETVKEVKARAEKRASEIRSLKRDNIKSVKVVQTSKNGYSIDIEYNSFERYIDRRISNLDTLTNTALVSLVNKFKNKEKVISITQKEAEKQLSLFEKLKTKELYQVYQEALGTPANTPFEKLLKELLKSYNFTVLEKEIKAVHGNDVAGAMNTIGQIIYLAKGGNRNKLTLAEETAHVLINALTSTNSESNSLLSTYREVEVLIEDTPFYKETLNQYSKDYINAEGEVDLNKVKKEAVGKALATVMTSKYSSDKTLKEKVISLFDDIVVAVKAFLQKHNLTEGTEAILHYKLNTLAESLVGKAIKSNEQRSTNTIQKIFEFIGIDTKSKHAKSEAEKDVEQRKEALKNSSAAIGFNYEYLNSATKENLLTKGITESAWKNYPLELQEAILKCLAK